MKTFIFTTLSGFAGDIHAPCNWFGAGMLILPTSGPLRIYRFMDAASIVPLRDFIADHDDDLFVTHDWVNAFHYLKHCGVPYPSKIFCTKTAFQYGFNSGSAANEIGSAATLFNAMKKLDLIQDSGFIPPTQIISEQVCDRMEESALANLCMDAAKCVLKVYGKLRELGVEYPDFYNDYLKTIPSIEDEGICLDMPTRDLIFAHKNQIISGIRATLNTSTPLLNEIGRLVPEEVERFLRSQGRFDEKWPRTSLGKISLERNYLKEARSKLPRGPAKDFFSEVLSEQTAVDALNSTSMVVDHGRNYHEVNAFGTKTGRNAPTSLIFQGQKWQRFLVIPEDQDHALLYVDFKAQELGIAAALSGDPGLRNLYYASDPYLAFARQAGVGLHNKSAAVLAGIRAAFKETALATLYGKTAWGLKDSLGTDLAVAQDLLATHRRLFPRFWSWQEDLLKQFKQTGVMETDLGWKCQVAGASTRTQQNFKIQATGADILRLSTIYLHQQELRVLALVHDGFLLTCKKADIVATKGLIDEALDVAVEQVLPGFKLRWVHEVHEGRFAPCKEGEEPHKLWMKLLRLAGLTGGELAA